MPIASHRKDIYERSPNFLETLARLRWQNRLGDSPLFDTEYQAPEELSQKATTRSSRGSNMNKGSVRTMKMRDRGATASIWTLEGHLNPLRLAPRGQA